MVRINGQGHDGGPHGAHTILNAEFLPGRGTVLLLREAIGF